MESSHVLTHDIPMFVKVYDLPSYKNSHDIWGWIKPIDSIFWMDEHP